MENENKRIRLQPNIERKIILIFEDEGGTKKGLFPNENKITFFI